MSGDTEAFDAIIAQLETPVFVVTTATATERDGCLVGFASQCSVKPPRFGVWLSKENRTYRAALAAPTLVVHVLRRGDEDLARLFGAETGDEVDKFEGVEWFTGPDGCPVLARCDWFAGSIIEHVDTGDHVVFLLAPHAGRCKRSETRQLGIHEIGDVEAGHPIPER